MSNRYFIDLDVSAERIEDEQENAWPTNLQALVMRDWTPANLELGGGNSEFVFDTKSKEVVAGKYQQYVKSIGGEKSRYIALYEVMPSSLWLYRLACVSKPIVNFEGPEGYKVVWSTGYKHVSGLELSLYDWKGGISVNVRYKNGKPTAKQKRYVCEFFSMLCCEYLAHPYDGTIAGCVA